MDGRTVSRHADAAAISDAGRRRLRPDCQNLHATTRAWEEANQIDLRLGQSAVSVCGYTGSTAANRRPSCFRYFRFSALFGARNDTLQEEDHAILSSGRGRLVHMHKA